MNEIVVSQKEVEEKAFPYESLQACESAFIDMRIPGHEGKKNYSIIGGGVTQSSRQFVNCYEAHGYNIGAVSLPVNHINGLHSHFTAEVFIVESGVWEIFWGPEGEHKVIVNPLSIISIPTGVFRGFRCIEEGFILTSLGGDDTGGVVWHPEVIETGNQHGVHLMANNMIVDRAGGENFPEGVAQMTLLNAAEIGAMRKVSPEEMSGRVSIVSQADFSERALLDNCLEGHRTGMAPVIGWGLTMDKTHVP
ncbi:MAG: cupin, partial [Spirochaetota bacterium]